MLFDSIMQELRYKWQHGDVVVKIIFANLLIFLAFGLLRVVCYLCGEESWWALADAQLQVPASFSALLYKPWTLITYMFYHLGGWHLAMNMLVLYWFAKVYEVYMRHEKLLALYLAGGLVGALFFLLSYNLFPVFHIAVSAASMAGASAAVFAIAFAAAALHPEHEMAVVLIGVIKIKYIVLTLLLMDIISIPTGNAGGYIAHVGGACTGWFFVSQLRRGRNILQPIEAVLRILSFQEKPLLKKTFVNPPQVVVPQKSSADQQRVDEILDKISRSGYGSLSSEEKEFLFRFSEQK